MIIPIFPFLGVSPALSLKRRYDASDLSDSENVDPASTGSATKRQKNHSEQDSYKPAGGFHLVTKSQNSETPVMTSTEPSPFTAPTSISTPKSAPLRASAGRSPKSKVSKAFSRRSIGAHARPRPTPSQRRVARAPFSISDALSGTFTTPQSKAAGDSSVSGVRRRKSWDFEIHVDTEQEEMANLMEHSTCTLDISDDEGKGALKDDRGKENIPPSELAGGVSTRIDSHQPPVDASRAIEMTDEPRAPLGELNLKDYVPEGINSSDSILIPEDDLEDDPAPKKTTTHSPLSVTETAAADGPPNVLSEQPQLASDATIRDLIGNSAPSAEDGTTSAAGVDNATGSSGADFDIWESGSVAEETPAAPAPDNC